MGKDLKPRTRSALEVHPQPTSAPASPAVSAPSPVVPALLPASGRPRRRGVAGQVARLGRLAARAQLGAPRLAPGARLQVAQRLLGGLLLGALLAVPDTMSEDLAVDHGLDLELAVVRRPA